MASEQTEEMRAVVRLKQRDAYTFEVSTDRPEGWTATMDEPPPLGSGAGPNAARMLAFAVGHCLSASLLFCLQKARVPVTSGVETRVEATIRRNERGRWRIAHLSVDLRLPESVQGQPNALERCLPLFKDYCIVTASVEQGIPVDVVVRAGDAAFPVGKAQTQAKAEA